MIAVLNNQKRQLYLGIFLFKPQIADLFVLRIGEMCCPIEHKIT